MAVGISGVRIKNAAFQTDAEGRRKIVGSYELVGTNGRVLATQVFNQYGGMDIAHSPASVAAIDGLTSSIEADISTLLGLEVVK